MLMVKEKLVIRGALASDEFSDWILHRARRLGLQGRLIKVGDDRIEALVAGPADLVDAMEVGCSLGPISVKVDSIERSPVDFDTSAEQFASIID